MRDSNPRNIKTGGKKRSRNRKSCRQYRTRKLANSWERMTRSWVSDVPDEQLKSNFTVKGPNRMKVRVSVNLLLVLDVRSTAKEMKRGRRTQDLEDVGETWYNQAGRCSISHLEVLPIYPGCLSTRKNLHLDRTWIQHSRTDRFELYNYSKPTKTHGRRIWSSWNEGEVHSYFCRASSGLSTRSTAVHKPADFCHYFAIAIVTVSDKRYCM